MRRNITKHITLAATMMVLLAGCQRELLPEGDVNFGDCQIRYSISNVGVKSSADDVPGTGSLSLVSGDGKLTVPVSCEVSEGIDLGSGSAETKGALINTSGSDSALPADLSFTVSAYKGSTLQFENKTATKRGDYWTMDPPQYWPLSTNLTFYASTNAGTNPVVQTADSQTLTYMVSGDVAAHKDLMLGYYKGNGGNKGIAEMRFDHPLTAVRFKKGEMFGVTGIKSITLSGLASGGTVIMDDDGKIGDWTVAGTEEYKTEVTLSGGETTLGVEESSQLIGTDSEGNFNGAFLLIPQTLSATRKVTVTAVLVTGTGDVTVSADIASGTWKAGMTNTYTLGYTSEDPSLLPGVFSVSATKKVNFTKGNLYWDGSAFNFEANQYEVSSSWSKSQVNHFYWSKNATQAYGNTASGGGDKADVLFTNNPKNTEKVNTNFTVNGVTGKFRALSKAEWEYLLNREVKFVTGKDKSYSLNITYDVNGVKKNGIVLYPDDYTGSKLSGTVTALPEGVVFLPFTGYRDSTTIKDNNRYCIYWSSASGGDVDDAYCVWYDFDDKKFEPTHIYDRDLGCCIRLVADCQ